MKEIAAALQLSARTVETHKYQMMQALGVDSTAELVKYAIEHRLFADSTIARHIRLGPPPVGSALNGFPHASRASTAGIRECS